MNTPGRQVPAELKGLGVSEEILHSHRGWDIHAEKVSRRIAEVLGAPLIVQRYSRLVIDANRPPNGPGSIPETSDNVEIPGNQNLSRSDTDARISEIFEPFNRAVEQGFSLHPRKVAFSVHSFTPNLSGRHRPWHAGFLSRQPHLAANRLLDAVSKRKPELILALNEPYQIDEESDWFIPVHAETRNLPNCLIEIRNDQISTTKEVQDWGNMLADAIREIMEELA